MFPELQKISGKADIINWWVSLLNRAKTLSFEQKFLVLAKTVKNG